MVSLLAICLQFNELNDILPTCVCIPFTLPVNDTKIRNWTEVQLISQEEWNLNNNVLKLIKN